ncbi:type II restriction endonuclease [uncultured Roseivirga sp.]|uniref:type II restriction endonuclease n=1 Tax=uncultured Roseivirga sp. TaxID=543088 RepID=UPI000D7B728A|nr:type II restriction endonuclease [uncultured Roseivirga sp.]PWL29075.1 MAG: restriction endonuclease [Roseivirga sp. XM-24bin3]
MSILEKAIYAAQQSDIAFTKFIKPNDTGSTGAHQAGFHLHKDSWPLFFDTPGTKGSNKDLFATIKWQDDFETDSRFIYYGVGTRNEYRLTRFGRGFPYLTDDNVGDLLILVKKATDYFEGYVLSSDEDIEDFFAALNISSTETNGIIPKQLEQSSEDKLLQCFIEYIKSLNIDFPPTLDLATNARNCYINSFGITTNQTKSNPDKEILNWLGAEYELFKTIENDRYSELIRKPFASVEDLVKSANTILNRRKSRAGKSLEHHLEEIFKISELTFQTQVITENNKKPDFLFPNIEAYNDSKFDDKKLVLLASKTTCKDRWRQILNEADRIKTKHLFTLQQGISKNQLNEMNKYGVQLVVPKSYLNSFPQEFRGNILTLEKFVGYVNTTQE